MLSVALTPDASEVLTGSEEPGVRRWDPATSEQRRRNAWQPGPVTCVTTSARSVSRALPR